MRVLFKVNLGSMDAGQLGLDFKGCTVGAEVDCDSAAGKWLVSKGIATAVDVPKPPEQPAAVVEAVEVQEQPAETATETPPQEPKVNKRK